MGAPPMTSTRKFRPDLRVFGVATNDPGWIYVVRNGDLIKVGKSINPRQKINRQAKTWLPDLEVIGTKPFWNISDTERLIHEGLSQFWYNREWFSFGTDEFGDQFIEDFREFYDDDRDMNSVDFIYWLNGSGMSEFVIERRQQGLSLARWFRQESGSRRGQ